MNNSPGERRSPLGLCQGHRAPGLYGRVGKILRARHSSGRTPQTCSRWVKRLIHYHNIRPPVERAEPKINTFLMHPAVKKKIGASAQNRALSALLFLSRYVTGREVRDLGKVIRARKPTHLPVVMAPEEVKAVPANLTGDQWGMESLICGAGLRPMECLRLRVQDIDFSRNEILVRDGKCAKDRITMLPESRMTPLQDHLDKVKANHEKDLAEGWGRVRWLDAVARKYANAPKEWRWQGVFPQKNRWKNWSMGEEGRHYSDESLVQKAMTEASAKAGLASGSI